MRQTIIIVVLLTLFCGISKGQKIEYQIILNSGLFNFTGESAESSEWINYNLINEDGYTNNPFGSKRGLSYGLACNARHLSVSGFVVGLELGYEVLRSKIDIIGIHQRDDLKNTNIDASGETYFNHHFLNLFPHLGRQIYTPNFMIELIGGLDLGFGINAWEDGSAETAERTYSTNRERGTLSMDLRPRIQIGIVLHQVGVFAGYSKGIFNYMADYTGGTNSAFSNFIRFGLSYRLK